MGGIFIVVIGVSGCGKSSHGAALAEALNMTFIEGDDLHPEINIKKMRSETPLTDEDRQPWLELVRATAEQYALEAHANGGCGVVISCSALKRKYRDLLRARKKDSALEGDHSGHSRAKAQAQSILPTYFVYIKGDRELILKRMEGRKGHYMKPSMLDSQFEDLESPEGEDDVVVVDAEDTTEQQVEKAKKGIAALGGEWYLKPA